MANSVYLGIDIGGSFLKVGVVSQDGTVLGHRQTRQNLEVGRETSVDLIFTEARRCLADASIDARALRGVGIAAPGTMDLEAGVVLHPFNLPGWENLPLRDIAQDRLQVPTVLINDANAAALGESWVGAGRLARSLMFWTLGTGIGGGIVMDGEVLVGAHGHAGECGQMIIQMEGGPRSEHNLHGSLELYAGARGLVRRCNEALASGASSVLRTIAEQRPVAAIDVARAAEDGDALAGRLVLETARFIAIGTVNILHILNPELVLIGGAMTFGQLSTAIGRQFIEEVRQVVRRLALPVPGHKTRIDYASLGNQAGFIGAARAALNSVHNS